MTLNFKEIAGHVMNLVEKGDFKKDAAVVLLDVLKSGVVPMGGTLAEIGADGIVGIANRVNRQAERKEAELAMANDVSPAETQYDSGFKFGRKSQAELTGVLPILINVFTLGLKYSTVDFMIYDGLRTKAEQAEYVKKGTSTTMNSKHLPQGDGLSHAGDAVPIGPGGIPVWDWELIYPVACAIDKAATELGVADKIVWGGAWDRRLSDFGGKPEAYRQVCQEYVERQKAAGNRKVFIDGPHFEWRG